MTNVTTLSDFDMFHYYGKNDLDLEIESDVLSGLIQPTRSLFYNRSDGCGAADKENYPISVTLFINLKYSIVNWMAKRNTVVSSGKNGLPDRRAATSQNAIAVSNPSPGGMVLNVIFVPFHNFQAPNNATLPLSIGG